MANHVQSWRQVTRKASTQVPPVAGGCCGDTGVLALMVTLLVLRQLECLSLTSWWRCGIRCPSVHPAGHNCMGGRAGWGHSWMGLHTLPGGATQLPYSAPHLALHGNTCSVPAGSSGQIAGLWHCRARLAVSHSPSRLPAPAHAPQAAPASPCHPHRHQHWLPARPCTRALERQHWGQPQHTPQRGAPQLWGLS